MWNSHLFLSFRKNHLKGTMRNSPEAEKPPPKWVEAVFWRGQCETHRGYDDLLFWRGPCETHLLRLKNHRQCDWGRFLTGTMWNSPSEALTTFFFDGEILNLPPNEDENTDNENNSQIQRPENALLAENTILAKWSRWRTIGRKHDNDQDDALLAENTILAKYFW